MTPGQLCSGGYWQSTHLLVGSSGCQALFFVQYAQTFNNTNYSQSYNITFTIPWIAEINASGGIVRLASPLSVVSWTENESFSASEVNISLNQTVNVTEASGNWTPNDTWAGSGAQWAINQTVLGTTNFSATFHMLNVSANAPANQTENASYSVEFDLGISQWPWASSSDRLAIGLQALGAWGARFVFNSTNQTLSELWNLNNESFVTLQFGPGATTYNASGTPSEAAVEAQSGLFSAATPDRESVTLLSFNDVAGNYTQLAYDPWVRFVPGVPVPVPPLTSPSSTLGSKLLLLGVAGGAVASILILGVIAVVFRRSRLKREGEDLVDGINRMISDDGGPPKAR